MLLVDDTTEDDRGEPAEVLGEEIFGAPDVRLKLSSTVSPPTETPGMVHVDREFWGPDERQPERTPTGGPRSSLRPLCRLIGRLVGIAIVFLTVLTIAPLGRPDATAIIAGSGSQRSAVATGPVASQPSSTTTLAPTAVSLASRGPAEPLQINLAEIALTVDPESLGFDIEPGTWVEPEIEPEGQWPDSGNGVAVPDLLLRIRFCESTNNYRAAHVASSARGAYQFLSKSWAWYGHAERYGVAEAHLATPAQQDAAALATYRQVGARPWAESRSCWDDPNIDARYLTVRPPPPPPTTAPPPADDTTTTSVPSTTAAEPTSTQETAPTTAMTAATQPTTTATP